MYGNLCKVSEQIQPGGVAIRVSTDHYHREQLEQLHFAEAPDELYQKFKDTFSDKLFTVDDNDNSDLYIVNLGRAKQLKNVGNGTKNVIDIREDALQYNYHRLAIRDACGCLYQSSCPVEVSATGKARIADYIIDCECYMDVYGNLMSYGLDPYPIEDKHNASICNIAEPVNLLTAVLKYNRSACTCSVGDNQKTMSAINQLVEIKEVLTGLSILFSHFNPQNLREISKEVIETTMQFKEVYPEAPEITVSETCLVRLLLKNWDNDEKQLILLFLLELIHSEPERNIKDILLSVSLTPIPPKSEFEKTVRKLNKLIKGEPLQEKRLPRQKDEVRCRYCKKVIVSKGRAIHAEKAGTFAKCQYCGKENPWQAEWREA